MGALAAVILPLMAACSVPGLSSGPSGYVRGFGSAVAADEPRAALVARDILNAGGSAADAATAAFFAMAVTLPSSSSLGSGGVCLVHDQDKKTAEAVEFLHPTDGPYAGLPMPLSVRGMYALHAKYGRLPWTQMVAPAEKLARLGVPVSRAFAVALAAADPAALASDDIKAVFAAPSGRPLAEGETLQQISLSATLSQIRRQPAQFYADDNLRRLVAAYRAVGIPLTLEALRDTVPRFGPPLRVTRRNQEAYFPPTAAGLVSAELWAILFKEGAYSGASDDDKAHVVAEATKRAYADAGRWFFRGGTVRGAALDAIKEDHVEALWRNYESDRPTPVKVSGPPGPEREPVDQGSASVIATDVDGQSVACAFTMNGIMGAGRIAPESGILIAAAPDAVNRGQPALGLMILRLGTQEQVQVVASATGGAVVPAALTTAALSVLIDDVAPERALDAPRIYNPGHPDRVMVEEWRGHEAVIEALRRKGHRTVIGTALGRVNLFVCPAGFERQNSQCDLRTDRRGFGLALQD